MLLLSNTMASEETPPQIAIRYPVILFKDGGEAEPSWEIHRLTYFLFLLLPYAVHGVCVCVHAEGVPLLEN